MNTAHARANTGGSRSGASHNAQPMKDRFKSAGVNAGTENFPKVLSTPPARETKEINKI